MLVKKCWTILGCWALPVFVGAGAAYQPFNEGLNRSPVTAGATSGIKVIPVGKSFFSPDKAFSVQLTLRDREHYFVIKDSKSGSTSELLSEYNPVFTIKWAPDSRFIVAVAHATETSLLEIIYRRGKNWLQFTIDCPDSGDDDKFHVVQWRIEGARINASYIVDHRDVNKSIALYRCDFDIDPATGKSTNVSKVAITAEQFRRLRTDYN